MDKSGFSTTCKESLEDALAQRVSDFRLDAALQVRLGLAASDMRLHLHQCPALWLPVC
jgi:hypothetical protein